MNDGDEPSARHRRRLTETGWSPPPAAVGSGIGFGGGDLVGAGDAVAMVDVGMRSTGAGGFHRVIPAVGPVQVEQAAAVVIRAVLGGVGD